MLYGSSWQFSRLSVGSCNPRMYVSTFPMKIYSRHLVFCIAIHFTANLLVTGLCKIKHIIWTGIVISYSIIFIFSALFRNFILSYASYVIKNILFQIRKNQKSFIYSLCSSNSTLRSSSINITCQKCRVLEIQNH